MTKTAPAFRFTREAITLEPSSLPGVAKPVTFALDKNNKRLWVTDVTSKTVDEVKYPSGGKILYQFTGFSEPTGVGVMPPSKP